MNQFRSSQKNRNPRNKGGRNKSSGNVTNRVYESAGPEGKVRGTPQQVVDKYLLLARDAQTSGDRVVAENFLQHAEHYIRLINAALPPQTEERRLHGMNGGHGDAQESGAEQGGDDGARQAIPSHQSAQPPHDPTTQARATAEATVQPAEQGSGLETIDTSGEDLPAETVVVTPESGNDAQAEESAEPKPRPRRRTRRPRNTDEVAAE